jgi:hypothetical protein
MTNPFELADEIAAKAEAMFGVRFTVNYSTTGYGKSAYIMACGATHYDHITVRVSDHSCNQRPRQVVVGTSPRLDNYRANQIKDAMNALAIAAAESQ